MAQAAGESTVTVATVYAHTATATFSVPVLLENPGQMAAGELEITYDPQVAQAIGVTRGTCLAGFELVENLTEAAQGKVKFTWAAAEGVSTGGILLEINFKKLTSSGATDLCLTRLNLYSPSCDQPLPVKLINGYLGPFNGVSLDPPKAPVSDRKTWTIHFNNSVDAASVNKLTIRVQNDREERVETSVSVLTGGQSVQVVPASNFAPGNYTLMVTQQVQAVSGKALKQPVRLNFTVN